MSVDLERELFALQVDRFLTPLETAVLSQLRPAIDDLLERVDALVARGAPITDADLERITAPLNDALARALERSMEEAQPGLRQLAGLWSEVVIPAPLATGATLMRQAEMDGTSMAAWFQRFSPSRWMVGVMAEIRRGIDAGWERHRQATQQGVQRLVTTAVESGTWSNGNSRLFANWTSKELIWHTREDELVCPICAPRQGERFSGASNGPPAHPRCRCVGMPVQGGVRP